MNRLTGDLMKKKKNNQWEEFLNGMIEICDGQLRIKDRAELVALFLFLKDKVDDKNTHYRKYNAHKYLVEYIVNKVHYSDRVEQNFAALNILKNLQNEKATDL